MAKRPCAGMCGALVLRGYCERCAKRKSPAAVTEAKRLSSCKRGYGRPWQRARFRFLAANPTCVGFPKDSHGIWVVAAKHVDHVIPVENAEDALFWDEANWQQLCSECHSRKTSTEDGGGGRVKSLSPARS